MGELDDPPERVADWLLLAFTIVSTIPFLIANGVVFVHRKRMYFQASGWDLILGSSMAGIIWIVSALVVNQHFKRDRVAFFNYCALWTFWFQLTLGVCLWLSFMALRLHHLYILCTTRRQPSSLQVWTVYIPLSLAPAIVFAIVATVKRISHHPCDMPGKCVIKHTGWKLSAFLVMPPLYFSLIVVLLVRLRRQSDFLLRTQYQHTKDYAMMAFVLYLLTGTTYWSNRQNNVEGRCFLTFCVCSIVFVHFWVHTGWPVYLCLFKRGDEMDNYEENLRIFGGACLQGCLNQPRLDAEGNVIPSLTYDGEEAIFQAIAAEQERKEDLKARKEQLHRRISSVRAQIEELKHQKAVTVLPHASQSLPPVRTSEKVLFESNQMTRHLSLEINVLPNYC